jgi:hypothetical protein
MSNANRKRPRRRELDAANEALKTAVEFAQSPLTPENEALWTTRISENFFEPEATLPVGILIVGPIVAEKGFRTRHPSKVRAPVMSWSKTKERFIPKIQRVFSLERMQAMARRLFSSLITLHEQRALRRAAEKRPIARPLTISHLVFAPIYGYGGGKYVLVASGAAEDLFGFMLTKFLERGSLDRIQPCPAENCDRLFFKTGRREYCSRQCQMRVFMRGYRA